jgi:hypothetical protein
MTDQERRSFASWILELAEVRTIRERRILAKWLVSRYLTSSLEFPKMAQPDREIPANHLVPKDFFGSGAGG